MRAAAAHDDGAVLKWCIFALACGGGTQLEESRPSVDAGGSLAPECSLPAELSACSGGSSYFHDGNANRCRLSDEDECSGNDNQFQSFEDCLRTCPEPVPEGCEGVLSPRFELLWCTERGLNSTTSLACEQLVEHPRREIIWHLLLEPSTDTELLEQRSKCVLRQLQALGVRAQANTSPDTIDILTTFARIASVLYTTAVQRVEISATRESCQGLSEEPCRGDPLCRPLIGTRVSAAECQSEQRFFGCTSRSPGCPSNAPSVGRAEDGVCWQFSDGCGPLSVVASGDCARSCP